MHDTNIEKIYIERINESQLRVYSDDFGIEQELYEFFSFYVPGFKFMPLFKNKVWDGQAHLYNIYKKLLPYGLLSYVYHFAEKRNYQIQELSQLSPLKSELVSIDYVKNFIDSLNIHSKGKKLDVRDYQIDAIYQSINRQKLICKAATSSGKSLILYVLIRFHLEHNRRTILLVPTTTLVTQMISDFSDYSSENGWNTEEFCHGLFSGKDKEWNKPVLVSTWQTIHSMTKMKNMNEFYESWDCYIGDECHRFAANSLQQISSRMINAKYRLGTTGTVQDDDASKLSLEGSFGPVYDVVSTKTLMDNKQVVDLKIKCIMLTHNAEIKHIMGKKSIDYQKELLYIVTNEKRNRFISKLAVTCRGNTLVLFQFVENHGKPLYEMIKAYAPERTIFYISGEVSVNERERIRHELDNHNNAIIVASVAILGTGVNIPSIENIIFASPSASKIRNLQSIGRGLRLKEGKTKCVLYDISDNLKYTSKHFKERIKIYSQEQFEFSLIEVKL